MQDSLVFLCYSPEEARRAADAFPRQHGIRRLFLFVGDRPDMSALTFLSDQDHTLALERLMDWADQPLEVATRAGLLYSVGWNVFFLWANRLASVSEVDEARVRLEAGEGSVKMPRVWAAERHHVAIEGWSAATPDPEEMPGLFAPVSLSDLTRAMAGQTSSGAATIAALQEVVPMESASLDVTVHEDRSPMREFASALAARAVRIDDELPMLRILGSGAVGTDLNAALASVTGIGAVVVVSETGTVPGSDLSPYRSFACTLGFTALVFQRP